MADLAAAYAALGAEVAAVDEDGAWEPTGCRGWVVRDLVFHLRADCLRALVAVHNPADRPADLDEVGYWRQWGSDPDADEQNRRHVRMEAGHYPWPWLRPAYVEANRAATLALTAADPAAVVLTQGHALTVEHLASTLVVEATLHHLDLVAHRVAVAEPSAAGLAETRRVCEMLLGRTLDGWSDLRVALVATGRAGPTTPEQADLGDAVIPVFT